MSWNFLISFAIGFGVYLIVLVIWSLIKKHKIKKQVEKEDKQVEVIDNENEIKK